MYKQLDSIETLRKLSSKIDLDLDTRIVYAKSAVDLSNKIGIDSTILKSKRNLAWNYLHDVKHYKKSRTLSHSILKEVKSNKDLLSEKIVSEYLAYTYFYSTHKDSAYYYNYKALNLIDKFESPSSLSEHLNDKAGIYLNIATLQKDDRDYYGSQLTAIKGVNLIKGFNDELSLSHLSSLYNVLALSLSELKEYDKAIEYHEKVLTLSKKISDNYLQEIYTRINLAEVYREIKDYNHASEAYHKLLNDTTLIKKDISSYAAVLNNLAYVKYLAKDKNINKIDSLYKKGHNIFKDLDLDYEVSASGNDMAEFYFAHNRKEEALKLSIEALIRSKKINELNEVLRALKMLSKLKKGDAGKQYLYEYIKLNDSLVDEERAIRNKFARIQFETDHYKNETDRLTTRSILIISIAGVLILVLALMYFIKLQRTKNKELIFESKQEKANQEIYKLMLKQQTKQEEVRIQERHRIAEDLHDGILSHLYGTRMGLGFLDVKGDDNTLEKYKSFMNELQQIEKDVREVSHELKVDDKFFKTNFKSFLEQYIKTQSITGHFNYNISYQDNLDFEKLNRNIRIEVYRIIQEALQNIIKHAKSKNVALSFFQNKGELEVFIEDDGIGFKKKGSKKGIGLKNIKSRLFRIKGNFTITSVANKGTKLRIRIPL